MDRIPELLGEIERLRAARWARLRCRQGALEQNAIKEVGLYNRIQDSGRQRGAEGPAYQTNHDVLHLPGAGTRSGTFGFLNLKRHACTMRLRKNSNNSTSRSATRSLDVESKSEHTGQLRGLHSSLKLPPRLEVLMTYVDVRVD